MKMKSIAVLLIVSGLFLTSAHHQTSVAVARIAELPKRVCIVGNVANQGEITFDDHLLLSEAIAKAGGLLPRSKQISILEPNDGKWGTLQILYRVEMLHRKSFKDHELPDRALIEVATQKGYDTPVPAKGVCPWVPLDLRGRM
jgi:protein involved in polysaccharide export with SLBB domain